MITDDRLYLTHHAEQRMDERGVGRPTLEAVLRCGETAWSRQGLRVICELCGYRVVIDPLHGAILTVYETNRRYAS